MTLGELIPSLRPSLRTRLASGVWPDDARLDWRERAAGYRNRRRGTVPRRGQRHGRTRIMIMGMGSRRRRDVPGEAPVGPASTVSDVIRDLVDHGWTIYDIAATLKTTTDHLERLLARDVPSAAVALAAQRAQCQGRSHQ